MQPSRQTLEQRCSEKSQVCCMPYKRCLHLGFRRLLQYQPGRVTTCRAKAVSSHRLRQLEACTEAVQTAFTARLPCSHTVSNNACQPASGRCVTSRLCTAASAPHHPYAASETADTASSSPVGYATSDMDSSESDTETNMSSSELIRSQSTSSTSIDESVTGYLQDDAATQAPLHVSPSEATAQVMCALLESHKGLRVTADDQCGDAVYNIASEVCPASVHVILGLMPSNSAEQL